MEPEFEETSDLGSNPAVCSLMKIESKEQGKG